MTLGLLVAVLALGDQRLMTVVLATPAQGDEVPATVRELALTFSREPDHAAVESAFSVKPDVAGAIRWRGKTLSFVPERPLRPGEYTLTVLAGKIGRGSEPLQDDFSLNFAVRRPGIAAIVTVGDRQELVELRPDGSSRTLLAAPRIVEFAVAPDATEIAVVTSDKSGHGGVALVPLDGATAHSLVQLPEINIGGVAWSPDGGTLLVIRRDRLPNGDEGVPRAWLLRRNGEFVAPIDPDGNPSLSPSWSPDGQQLAYVSPSDARVVVRNLSTEDTRVVGQPRGGAPSWSADSQAVAFESVPSSASSNPPQPVRAVSLDGVLDRSFGIPGEVRIAPKFWDENTLASLRRGIGAAGGGTQLVFESLSDGRELRAIPLTGGADLILNWDIDPGRTKVVFSVRSAVVRLTTIELDIESGHRTVLPIEGDTPKWVP